MNLKKEIRTTKKNLADAYKRMKRWIQDPEAYLMNSCGDERENQITHAVYEFGRLQVLRKLVREESK
jgi:hypothetical protein